MYGWTDGRLEPLETATLSVLDGGATHGDGVFTTLVVRDSRPQLLDRHVRRLTDDARAIAIPGPLEARVRAAARAVVSANAADGASDHVLRLVVTRGPAEPGLPFGSSDGRRATVVVTSAPLPRLRDAVALATVQGARRPAHVKSLSWAWSSIADARAREAGADVALLLEGEDVLEATSANVVVVADGLALTPPADGRLLPGITRGLLLEEGALEERPVQRVDIARADEVLLLSAVRGVTAVTHVDGVAVGTTSNLQDGARDGAGVARTPGPVEAALRARLETLQAVGAGHA